MKTILITGGAGFIGSHVVRRFIKKYPDYKIVNLDKLTYAGNLNNLTDIEKESLFSLIHSMIKPGGRVVFVDLMYRNADQRQKLMEKYRNVPDVYESFEEEFYWNLDLSTGKLMDLDFEVTTTQFSELSFGILAECLL